MKKTTLALASALALLGAGASFAQPPGPPPADGRPSAMRMQRPDPAQMAERRAQRLRDTLQLRPEQEPALRAFVSALQPQGDRMNRMRGDRGGPEARTLTTPERLDRMRARLAERQAAFERRADATKRFYAQLSPAQQRAFDAIGPMGGRGRHGMGAGLPGMRHHGPGGPGGFGPPRG
jgi:hypothetical protein